MVMPGMIDPVSGTVLLSLEQKWENVNLKELAQNKLGIPVTIETDNNMLALGEYICGLGQKVKDFVLIDIEDGCMGSSYILNGQLQRGSNNMSGEIGHISCNSNGPKCSCGKNGCFEAYIKSAMKRKEQNWMSEVAYYISMMTSILINILDPKIVVFSGRILGKNINEFISEIEKEMTKMLLSTEKRDIQIKSSALGESARLKGICEIVFDNNYSTI